MIRNTNAENLEENLEKIKDILTKIRESQDIKNVGIATCSTWMAVVNPKFFMPINSNTLSKEIVERINFKRVVGGEWDIDGFVEFIKAINSVKEELSIETATEIAYYLSKYGGNSSTTLKNYFTSKGYHFPDHLIAQFYTALKTKGFVIPSGLTGTGKTKIALEFAELLSNSNKNTLFLSVRPDWRDSKPLLGYYNPIDEKYYETPLLEFILKATTEYQLSKEDLWKKRIWFIKCGEEGENTKYAKMALHGNYISIGWYEVPDLRKLSDEELEHLKTRKNKRGELIDGRGQLKTFFHDISVGDIVVMPLEKLNDKEYKVAIGVITSEYYYEKSSSDTNPQKHRRKVIWLIETILEIGNLGWTVQEVREDTMFLQKDKIITTITNTLTPHPYFIILDEMNLAHVEYYFADFLSVLESGRDESGFTMESIKLHDVDKVEKEQGIPKELKLPPNLYIIGTVNIDETTYMFSPKVLDRAFTIELHDVELDEYLEALEKRNNRNEKDWSELRNVILKDLRRDGKFLAVSKKEDIEPALNELKKKYKEYWKILNQLNKALEPYDLHFGYRVVDEIALFFKNAKESSSEDTKIISFTNEDEIFDLVLLMKILPKFHGNRKKLEKPLKAVFKICLKENQSLEELNSEKIIEMLQNWENERKEFRFPHTAKKVLRMLRQLYEIGFASFS